MWISIYTIQRINTIQKISNSNHGHDTTEFWAHPLDKCLKTVDEILLDKIRNNKQKFNLFFNFFYLALRNVHSSHF